MDEDEDQECEREERAIYAIIAAAASPVVIGVLIEGSGLDAGSTLTFGLAACALVGLGSCIRALSKSRLPRAKVHRRTR